MHVPTILVLLLVAFLAAWIWVRLSLEEQDKVIRGRAWVIDGDTIRVAGHSIRLAGIDAPELGQHTPGWGRWSYPGEVSKIALIRQIGGEDVVVVSEGIDKYGRTIGTVWYDETDLNRWLVAQGYAIAAYGEQYKTEEREARRRQRGIWQPGLKVEDPRRWRARMKR